MARRLTLPGLVTKADKLTSEYIRRKWADHAGNVKCCTCEKVLPWKESHTAHFVERGKVLTRWLEENLHPACPSCNVYRKEFHKRQYTLYMVDCYGRAFVDELNEMAKVVVSPSQKRQLAEEAIEYYGGKLKEM